MARMLSICNRNWISFEIHFRTPVFSTRCARYVAHRFKFKAYEDRVLL